MLYSFTPSHGRLANAVYYFPNTSADSRSNDVTSTLQSIANADGVYDSSGTNPMPLKDGTFTVTFDLFPAWYKQNGNRNNRDYYNATNDDFVARENALLHFIVAVKEGGQGLLVDGYGQYGHTGIIDPASGAAISSYSAQAKVSGAVTIERNHQISHISVAMSVTSAYWKLSTGQVVQFF